MKKDQSLVGVASVPLGMSASNFSPISPAILGNTQRSQPIGGRAGGRAGGRECRAQEAAVRAGEALPGALGRERGLQEGTGGPGGDSSC
eukprot:2363616-Prymnesium_polylepis.1